MEISFEKPAIAKLCNSSAKLRKRYGPRMSELIQQRLFDLMAAESLSVMSALPGRCHPLTENFKWHFAVDLIHPIRLVFVPDHDPIPTNSGNIDLEQVTAIKIVGIGDYHK